MSNGKILIVEDEASIRKLLDINFKQRNFETKLLENGENILFEIRDFQPELIILDVMLGSGEDGFKIIKTVKAEEDVANIPIFFLTARNDEEDILTGLNLGADDYIKKPFSPKELTVRVEKTLKRNRTSPKVDENEVVSLGNISLNRKKITAMIEDKAVNLTMSEFKLLELFLSKPDNPFERNYLIDRIRGPEYAVTERVIDVLISGLRKKIKESNCKIESVRSYGYKLNLS